MLKKIILVPVLICLLAACASLKGGSRMPKKLSEKEYLSWYESTAYPFRDTVKLEGITYVCALIPRQLEIARQLNNQLIQKEEAKQLLLEKEDMLQFQLQIMLPQTGTDVLHYKLKQGEDVSSRTSYFSFGIKKDLYLKYSNADSTDCSSLHFEKGISNLPISRLMFYFPYKNEAVRSVVFNTQIFSASSISFGFKELKTTDLPKLNL